MCVVLTLKRSLKSEFICDFFSTIDFVLLLKQNFLELDYYNRILKNKNLIAKVVTQVYNNVYLQKLVTYLCFVKLPIVCLPLTSDRFVNFELGFNVNIISTLFSIFWYPYFITCLINNVYFQDKLMLFKFKLSFLVSLIFAKILFFLYEPEIKTF